MKKQAGSLDAKPSKRLYLSIISDYDLNTAICELVDNALDIWIKGKSIDKINIDIEIDLDQQTIKITDNVGGVKEENLRNIISPGSTSNDKDEETIGLFGVGSKRAVVALAQLIKFTSRYKSNQTFSIEYDDDWIRNDDDWDIQYYKVDDINESTTIIELVKLRNKIYQSGVNNLAVHLSSVYSKYIETKKVVIRVNGIVLEEKNFEQWAFPNGYEPCIYETIITTEENESVNIKIVGGLSSVSSPAGGEYGVYFYCNNRLISKAKKDSSVGFVSGMVGLPHPSMSLVRVFVYLNGPAKLMIWNSSKSDINVNSNIFKQIEFKLIEVLKYYVKISKSLDWETGVFPYKEGEIKKIKLDSIKDIKIGKLLKPPKKNINYEESIKKENKELSKNKPWTTGLYESVIAAHYIFNRDLKQKNRITLIILDSTLEIAFKEYIINEKRESISTDSLTKLFKIRNDVVNKVKELADLNNKEWNVIWSKVNYYYNMRCKLVHEKAEAGIRDDDITDYNEIIQKILNELFGLKFEIDN